jgi:protoheme IX farnesyltransferase
MLHDRIGEDATRWRIVLWTLALLPATLAPWALGMLGAGYAAAAGALGAWFLAQTLVLLRRRDRASARRTFLVSLAFLLGTFGAMIGDLLYQTLA